MCDPRKSLEKVNKVNQQVSLELVKEAIDAYRKSRVCVGCCSPSVRQTCHENGITPDKCTEPKQQN